MDGLERRRKMRLSRKAHYDSLRNSPSAWVDGVSLKISVGVD
jgi:hypothetical protein